MALYEPWISSHNGPAIDSSHCQRAGTALEMISMKIVENLPEKLPKLIHNNEGVSPWGLYLAYQAYVTFLRLNRETGNLDAVKAMNLLKQTLRALNTRWRAAGKLLYL